jgi:hypothetical protein
MDILNSGYLPAVVECETIDQWISTCCCGMRTRGHLPGVVEYGHMDQRISAWLVKYVHIDKRTSTCTVEYEPMNHMLSLDPICNYKRSNATADN